jgi:F-type H+-transporting ATPase subunit b
MSSAKKLSGVALLAVAVFVITYLVSFAVTGVATAFAQPAGGSDHGFAPPSDETPPTNGELPGVTNSEGAPEGTGHVEEHFDPSQHFNFLNFHWHGKDEFGGKFGDGQMVDEKTGMVVKEEEPMSPPFVFMVLNFLLLLGILVWKGKPAAQQMAAERHDQIKTALDEAAKLRQQAADKLAEYEAKLKDADAEIKAMVDGMKKDAEADKARILDNAAKQSAQLKKDAEARIAAEIEFARAALTREVTAAAALATEKILREKMMPADQSKLVTAFINDVQAASAVDLKERR